MNTCPVSLKNDGPVLLAVTAVGAALARRIASALGADLILPQKHAFAGESVAPEGIAREIRAAFADCRPVICIMATGIVVRALDGLLQGKDVDPPVVVLDEKGEFAISLLSGHLGGGNDLARRVAALTGGTAVITTATDVQGFPAWDEAARHAGCRVEPVERLRRFNALLLEGGAVTLVDREGLIADAFRALPFVSIARILQGVPTGPTVLVTDRLIPGSAECEDLLLIRPPSLAVGVGCNRGSSVDEIADAVEMVLADAWLSPASIGVLGSIEAKGDEVGLLAYRDRLRVPLCLFSADALNGVSVSSQPSQAAMKAVGAKGVSEPAALLAGRGELLIGKKKMGNVTVAVARRV